MLLQSRRRQGPIRGCVIPILTVAGIIGICYLACLVLFNLNNASMNETSSWLPVLFA